MYSREPGCAGFRAYCVERGAVLRGTPERTLTTAMVRMRLAAWDPGPAPSAIVAPSAIAPLEAFRLPASLRAPHAAALEAVVAGAQARAAGTDASWTPYLAATDGDALASWPEPLRENLGELARLLREAESDATPSVLSDFFLALYEDSLELPRGSGCAMARAFAAGMLIAEHDRLLGREREIARSLARREASLTMHAESQRALARSVEHQSGDDLVAGAYRLSANDGTFPDEILAPLRSAIDAYVGATDDDGPERDALRAAVASLVEAPVGAGAEVVDERADFVEAAARVRRLYVALGQNGVAGVRRASRAEERDNPAEEELDWARFLEVCR